MANRSSGREGRSSADGKERGAGRSASSRALWTAAAKHKEYNTANFTKVREEA